MAVVIGWAFFCVGLPPQSAAVKILTAQDANIAPRPVTVSHTVHDRRFQGAPGRVAVAGCIRAGRDGNAPALIPLFLHVVKVLSIPELVQFQLDFLALFDFLPKILSPLTYLIRQYGTPGQGFFAK